MKLVDLKLGIDSDIQNHRDRARIMRPLVSPLLPDSAKLLRKARINSRALDNLGEKERIVKENSTLGVIEKRSAVSREQRYDSNGVGSPSCRLRSNQPGKNDTTNLKFVSKPVAKHQNTDQKDTLFGVKPKSQDKKSQLPLLKLLNMDQTSRPSPMRRNLQDVLTAREISSIQEKENLTDRIEHPTEPKGSHLFHSKSTKEATAHSKQLQSAPLKPKVILEHAIIREGRSLDTVVIKEPFRDRYSIFAMDFLSGQRYELHFSSEDVQNILEGDILVTSVEEKQVWTSLLQKVDLKPVKDFSKIKTRDIPSTGAKIKVFERFQNGLFSADSVEENGTPYGFNRHDDHADYSFASLPQIIVPAPAASNSASASSSASSCATSTRTGQGQGHRRGTVHGTTPPTDISDYILPQHSYEESFEDNLSQEDSADYDLEFDSFEASDDYHKDSAAITKVSAIPTINTNKAGKLEDLDLAQIYPQYNIERDIAEVYKSQRNGSCSGSNNDKMSPTKKLSDASGSTPHSRRASLQLKPATPHSVQQRARSVPHEAVRAVIGELQLQPHPPKTTQGVGHRQPGGRSKQGEAMSRLAAPPRRSPRPPSQLSPGMSSVKPKGPNISLLHVGQPSPERAVDPPSVVSIQPPKSVDRVKFHPVPPLEPVQHFSRPQRSQANKKAVPGKKGPNGSDPPKLSISVKAAPGRKKQAVQLFITAAPASIDNVHDNQASNFSSPYLQAAAGYNYEADDYEVDYEIFSVNPGDKLPLLGAALAVSPVPETHRLEEPSVSSRSVCRTFNDDSMCVLDELMVTVPDRKMNNIDVKRATIRESFSLDNSVALPGAPRLNKGSDARKVVLEVEVPTKGADVITSGPGTGTGTYSKEGFDDDCFSYGSIGGWDNYVDEDVEGESYDLDEDEINAAESEAVTLASSSAPVQHVGAGKGSGPRTDFAPGTGGKGHRYERSMYSEFDTSANTTVCLNSAAIREVVRNLDEGVEYRIMPICN